MKIEEASENLLARVTLRLMEEGERERFDRLLEEEHYLKSSRIGGRHLRYVAEADGKWIAICRVALKTGRFVALKAGHFFIRVFFRPEAGLEDVPFFEVFLPIC